MKRPLIPVALLYVLGLLLAPLLVPLVLLFVIAFVLLFLALAWTQARPVLLCLLLVLAGWINLAQRTAILSPIDLRTQLLKSQADITVRGVLPETPYRRVYHDEQKNKDVWTSMARLDVSAFRTPDQDWQPAFGRVMTSTLGFLPDDIFAGQTIEISGDLQLARGPVAEGLFDYRNYLNQQGIYFEQRALSSNAWTVISSPSHPPMADRFCAWARKTLAIGMPIEDESLRLEWALTLGWKAALTDEVSEPFIRAATYHIFAVDGLRIAIVSGIFLALFRAIGIPRAWCGLLAVPLIFFYAAMTGWPASAIRAIVMIMVVFGGWALKRPSDLINSLFAAAIIILVWEPRQLFQAGFQLSFFVVLCIVLILPFFKAVGEHILRPDPLLPEALEPRWKKLLRMPARYLVDLFMTSTAAWLGSIPLVALYFHLVTPLSGPANVLAVPLCVLVLISNLSSLLFAWLPFVAELFNNSGWFFMECIRTTSQWSANWPGAYFYLSMPGLFTIGLYYFILITVLTGWLFQGKHRKWKISVVSLLTLVWCGIWLREWPATRVTILPLNIGHAVYLQPPGSRNDWLIDCGNESSVQTVVKPFLRAHGVNRLDNFVLTHGEIAYSGGAKPLLDLFRPRNIYLSSEHFRSPEYVKLIAGFTNEPALREPIQAGSRLGPWAVLYPDPARHFSVADDKNLVLRAEINGTRVLLCSDLGHAGQNALFDRNLTNDLRADIVVAGIPDKAEPLNDTLLDAIQPRVIIIANSIKQPVTLELRNRLALRNVPVFYTSKSDAVTLTIRPNYWEARAMDGTKVSSADPVQR